MDLDDLTPEQLAAIEWLTDERNTVAAANGDGVAMTSQEVLDGLSAQFADIAARLALAVEQHAAAARAA